MKQLSKLILASLFLGAALFGASGAWNGVAFTGWDGVAITSWNGTAISTASSGVTPAVGNVFSERFVTGYTNAGWTDVNSTIAVNAALPSGSGLTTTTSLNVTYAGGANAPYNYYHSNLGGATEYVRFYIYIDSESMGDTDKRNLFTVMEAGTDPTSTGDISFALRLDQTAGVLLLKGLVHDGTLSAGQIVTSGTWYRVEFRYQPNTAVNGLTFRLYDAAGSQIGTDQLLGTSNWFFGYSSFGMGFGDNTNAVHAHYAAYDISDTGYLGP